MGTRIWTALVALVNRGLNNGFYTQFFNLIDFLYRWGLVSAPAHFAGALSAANIAGTYANGTAGVGATFTTSAALTTLDGVTLTVGMTVLLAGQSTGLQNGLYTVASINVSSTVLTRYASAGAVANPWNVSANMVQGSLFLVTAGTTYGGTTWAYTGASSPTVGTTALTFAADSLLRSAVSQAITAAWTFAAGTLKILNAGGTFATTLATAATAARTFTLPDATDTAVGLAATQTLANKTLTAPAISAPVVSGSVNLGQGTVTQATSITTGVTVNAASGVITTVSSTLGALTATSFTVTNSAVVAGSAVVASVENYGGTYVTNGIPIVNVQTVGAGSFIVEIVNVHPTNPLAGVLKIAFVAG